LAGADIISPANSSNNDNPKTSFSHFIFKKDPQRVGRKFAANQRIFGKSLTTSHLGAYHDEICDPAFVTGNSTVNPDQYYDFWVVTKQWRSAGYDGGPKGNSPRG
jgi:hypothetical protein